MFASSSLVTVRATKESSFGVVDPAGATKVLRITGENLDYSITKESSKEINDSRTIASMIPVTASAPGNVTAELSYGTFDDFFESGMQGAWAVLGTNGETAEITADFTATTLTASVATAGADDLSKLLPGQWFRVDSAGPNEGKILRVSPTVAPTDTIVTLDPSTPAVVSAAEDVKVQSSRLTHGKTQTSFTIERENSDIDVFTAYFGQTLSKFNVNIASGALTALTFDFMGKSALESDTTQLPGVPVPPSATDIHSGVSGATNAIWMDGAPVTGTHVKSVTLDFDNALRSQEAIGTLGAIGLGSSTINCSLTVSIYFATKDLFTKFRKNINTSIVFASTDMDGNGYIFTVPVANISTLKSNSTAKDQDQMVEVTLTALEDRRNTNPALRKVLFIDRIGAAVV